jgi:hypothetical protein
MLENMKRVIIILILGIAVRSSFSQAWIKPKGSGYSQIGYSYISSSKIYGVDNLEEQLRRAVTDQTIQGYLEYGVGNNLMFTASVPFKMLSTGNEIFETDYVPDTLVAGSLSSIGNISLAGVYGIKQNAKWVSSVGLGLDTKTASFDSDIGLRTGVDAWSGLLNFNLGRGWDKTFFQSSAGIKLRSNNYSSQFIAAAQIGRTMKKVQVIFGLELYQSFKDGSYDDGTSIQTGLYQNDLEFLSFSLKANYAVNEHIKVWGFIGGGLVGQLVARAPSYALTVSYEWKKEKKAVLD